MLSQVSILTKIFAESSTQVNDTRN